MNQDRMKDSKAKKAPAMLTREDLSQIAADADARMGRVGRKVKAILKVTFAALMVVLAATLYLGLIAAASVLVAVCLVTFTLYLFVRLWPGVAPSPPRPPSVSEPVAQALPVVSDDAPRAAKHRILWSLREMSRRQDDFIISGRAAERFARTIRFVLKNEK